MMICEDDKDIRILAGTKAFHSAFVNRDKKIRYRAHKRLVGELKSRGYFSNGKKPDPLPDMSLPEMGCWEDATAGLTQLMGQLEKMTKDLETPREPTTHYTNPDLGQKIPLDVLIGATKLWPLSEVMELVPTHKAENDGCE